ncbi:hypothetical protein MGG_17834 [Pyricularia oryzae 70-15]|uniref:Uncharacterized protein n=1 Tax=Pyricularia oryzae (strain 70-15 / ATCC MYA-4617 / FGSC 8958) TaxID=242507 RepID=G4NIF4_PYRO7|nr:uncharacterized protein MGG_17834 [Pyricularia oryzae 70-15]EHA48014.1 hypothetical protein MGG_17834 [Pyricularia oryzae 70-15]
MEYSATAGTDQDWRGRSLGFHVRQPQATLRVWCFDNTKHGVLSKHGANVKKLRNGKYLKP